MIQQRGLAMGLGGGPTNEPPPADPYAGGEAAHARADVQWLDKASSCEQGTITWAVSRASAQVGYEWTTEGRNWPPDDLDSTNPLPNLLASAMRTMSQPGRASNNPDARTRAELPAEPWMQGFGTTLDAALAQTVRTYG